MPDQAPPPSSWPQRMQALLAHDGDLSSAMAELATIASAIVGMPVSCGITLRYDGVRLTAGASDVRADLLDETQSRAQHGPCVESMETALIVRLPDTAVERRWPHYVRQAVDDGLRSSLSLPLTIGQETFGALNVYAFDATHVFDETRSRRLELLAAQTAVTVRIATRQLSDARLLEQMEQSLRSRAEIDQAIGIIMATHRCSSAEAFELMRRESQRSQRRLRDIAAELVTRTGGQAPEVGRPFERP